MTKRGSVLLVTALALQTFAPAGASFGGSVNGLVLGIDEAGVIATYDPGSGATESVPGIGQADGAAFSWGARSIVFARGGSIWRLPFLNLLAWSAPTPTRLTSGSVDRMPSWSPDGKKIVFLRAEGSGPARFRVYAMDRDGKNVVPMTEQGSNTAENAIEARWSPDGKRIAYISDRQTAGLYQLHVIDLQGTPRVVNLGRVASTFDWSPDGSQLVVARSTAVTSPPNPYGGYASLYLVDAYTGAETVLKDNSWSAVPEQGRWATNPQWSPDGFSILFREDVQHHGGRRWSERSRLNLAGGWSEAVQSDYVPLWWAQDCGYPKTVQEHALDSVPGLALSPHDQTGAPAPMFEASKDGVVVRDVPSLAVDVSGRTGGELAGTQRTPAIEEARVTPPGLGLEEAPHELAVSVVEGSSELAKPMGVRSAPPLCREAPATPPLWPLPAAETLAATNVTATAATLRATVDGKGSPVTYRFDWGPTNAFGSSSIAVPGSGTVSLPVSGLIHGTTYHFRVRATNRGGTTIANIRTFTTPTLPPPSGVSAELYIHGVDGMATTFVQSGGASYCTMWDDFRQQINTGVTKYSIGFYDGDEQCSAYIDGHEKPGVTRHTVHRPNGSLVVGSQDTGFETNGHTGPPGQGGGHGRPSHHSHTPIEHLGYHWAWYIYDTFTSKNQAVNIVAHSMGGLITRYALAQVERGHPDFPPRLYVYNVVTLGTPFGGASQLASFGCAQSSGNFTPYQCYQMRPGSAFLDGLKTDTAGRRARNASKTSIVTDWSTVGSEKDYWVPETSAVDMEAQHRYYFVAHGLPFSSTWVTHSGVPPEMGTSYYGDKSNANDMDIRRSDNSGPFAEWLYHYNDVGFWVTVPVITFDSHWQHAFMHVTYRDEFVLLYRVKEYDGPHTKNLVWRALNSAND